MIRNIVPLTAALLLSLASIAHAQSADRKGGVRVTDSTGAPVAYATVRFTCLSGACADSSITRLSDRNGTAFHPFAARVAVVVTHVAFHPHADTLGPGEIGTVGLRAKVVGGRGLVVTGQYVPTDADRSLYKVRSIDREQIDARGAQNLRDLMQGELNVRLSQDNVLGSSMSLQGLSGYNVKILIDGLPVIGRVGEIIDIGQINLNEAERVEVIEGPLSVVYGTDALGGVVNIITRKGASQGMTAKVDLHGESVGVVDVDGRVTLGLSETRALLSGGRHFFAGFARPDTSRFKRWKPRVQYFGNLDLSRRFGDLTAEYSVDYGHDYILNRGVPRAPYRESAFDDTYLTERLTNRLQLNGELGPGILDFSAGYSLYTRRKNTYVKNLVTLQEQPVAEPSEHDTTGFDSWTVRATLGAPDTGVFSWQAGLDALAESTSGGRVDEGYQSGGDYALFGSVRYSPVEWLAVQPAIRGTYNTRYDAPLIPSLNLKADAGSGITLRGSYARGFRAPSLRDLYFYFVDINHHIVGNQDLRAETSHNVNLSFGWRKPFEESLLDVEASGYYNAINDLITLVSVDGDLYSYRNIGTYATTGMKLNARYDRADVTGSIGMGWTGRENDNALPGVERFSFALEAVGELTWRIDGLGEISTDYKYTGNLPYFIMNEEGIPEERYVDDFHMLNLSVARSFLDDMFTVRAGAKNLLDVVDVPAGASDGSAHGSGETTMSISWGRTFFINLSASIR